MLTLNVAVTHNAVLTIIVTVAETTENVSPSTTSPHVENDDINDVEDIPALVDENIGVP